MVQEMPPSDERMGRRGGERRILLVLALALIGGLWGGCTAQKRYRVLSFFFDGVPDPNAPHGALAGSEDQTEGGKPIIRAVVYTHKPYAENKCDTCHVGASGEFESFTKLDASICLKCHAHVPTEYPVMHGPVALAECTWCHVPHESTIKGLLKQAAPGVCVQCHERSSLPAKPADHLSGNRSCLDCHVPHGAAWHGLLREGVAMEWESGPSASTTMPTTRASTAPTTGASTAPASPMTTGSAATTRGAQ